jgi:hypothetical protein
MMLLDRETLFAAAFELAGAAIPLSSDIVYGLYGPNWSSRFETAYLFYSAGPIALRPKTS